MDLRACVLLIDRHFSIEIPPSIKSRYSSRARRVASSATGGISGSSRFSFLAGHSASPPHSGCGEGAVAALRSCFSVTCRPRTLRRNAFLTNVWYQIGSVDDSRWQMDKNWHVSGLLPFFSLKIWGKFCSFTEAKTKMKHFQFSKPVWFNSLLIELSECLRVSNKTIRGIAKTVHNLVCITCQWISFEKTKQKVVKIGKLALSQWDLCNCITNEIPQKHFFQKQTTLCLSREFSILVSPKWLTNFCSFQLVLKLLV